MHARCMQGGQTTLATAAVFIAVSMLGMGGCLSLLKVLLDALY